MSIFGKIVLEAFKGITLKRVRIKVDPSCPEGEPYAEADGYEGYILREDEGIAQVFVVGHGDEGDGSIFNVPIGQLAPEINENFNIVKSIFLEYLDSEGLLEGNNHIIDIVTESTDPTELRLVSQQLSVSDSDLLKCYEYFIKD
jgi:hypothetical protein